MDKYVLTKAEIVALSGVDKTHFLNPNAKRINKSLGDIMGITGFGFHIIEVPSNCYSTELHRHYYEDECVYVLSGTGLAMISDEQFEITEGEFIGYPAGGMAHTILNTGQMPLKMIVVGSRLAHDVTDYPNLNKRLYRNQGMDWHLVDTNHVKNIKR